MNGFLNYRVTSNLVSDESYWTRCCKSRWEVCDVAKHGNSWKRMYFERNLEGTVGIIPCIPVYIFKIINKILHVNDCVNVIKFNVKIYSILLKIFFNLKFYNKKNNKLS